MEMWIWKRLLRVSRVERKSNAEILQIVYGNRVSLPLFEKAKNSCDI